MRIYGHPLSSCTRKVLLLLAEKHQPAELVLVDLLKHEHHSEEHRARHAFGRVPVLDDDGFVLTESRAILRYLDEHLPGPSFTPTTVQGRARMQEWLSVDQSYVAPATRELAVQRILRPHAGENTNEEAVAAARAELTKSYDIVERALATSRYLAGDTLTLADISLAPYVAALPMLGCADLLAGRPQLQRWWSEVSARPSASVLRAS